jgi:hypothetical protein
VFPTEGCMGLVPGATSAREQLPDKQAVSFPLKTVTRVPNGQVGGPGIMYLAGATASDFEFGQER